MTTRITYENIYSGQLLWAFCSSRPYWPSIVCASSSGEVQNKENSVHVKFCSNGENYWIHLDNVFEFKGHESYKAIKRSMQSTLPNDDFRRAFDTTNYNGWKSAVIEATFMMSKDAESRMDWFDILSMIDNVNTELGKIASNISFDETTAEPQLVIEPPRRRSHRLVQLKRLQVNPQTLKTLLSNETSEDHVDRELDQWKNILSTYDIHSYPQGILFQGLRAGNVCKICCSIDNGSLVKCSSCGDYVHSVCNNNEESFVQLPETPDRREQPKKRSSIKIVIEAKVLCNECRPSQSCFVCKDITDAPLRHCDVKSCRRYYHIECLDTWKQIELIDSKFKCPLHVCHTCFSIDKDPTTMTTKFTFCVKCPTAYHCHSSCIPAGTKILTQKHHVCIRHRSRSPRTSPNLDWCVRCGNDGNALICCGYCPKTYHMSCLEPSEDSDHFMCTSCRNGNHPLYGQIIVAKYGEHPWWPAVIVPPFKIPKHMYDVRPDTHEFCVRFFGEQQFGWIGRSSVCLCSKSEVAKFPKSNKQQIDAFKEAANWMGNEAINNNESNHLERNKVQPKRPDYIKISTISIVAPAKLIKSMDEPSACSCDADDPCGPTSDCENREVFIECDPEHCANGLNCKNQSFERHLHAVTEVKFIDDKKGFGLIAGEFINAGTLVIEYVGELITENELMRRKNRKQSRHIYFMTYTNGLYIDSEKKGNNSRFVNHSCNPNCEMQKWTVKRIDRIGYFALKDIEKGTEITVNYDFAADDKLHQCFCGEENCKGVIGNWKN